MITEADLSGGLGQAQIHVLSAHPAIDSELPTLLQVPDPNLLAVIAGAMRQRIDGRDESIAAVYEAWRPAPDAALAFARAIDSRYSSSDPFVKESPSKRTVWTVIPHTVRVLLLLGVGPIVSSITWNLANRWGTVENWPTVGIPEAVGVFAIFVAVHIFSAEQGAARLPGLLARRTSSPPALLVGYSTSLSAIALAAFSESDFRALQSSISATICVAIAVAMGVLTIVSLVRRTDPVIATSAFVRTDARSFIRAGRRVRRTRELTSRGRASVRATTVATLDAGRPLAERRVAISARRTGALVVSRRGLKRIERAPNWKGGRFSLRLQQALGSIVQVGDEVAWIVPSREATVSERDVKLGGQVISFRRQSKSERETVEAAAILVGLADDTAKTGNASAGARIASAIVGLLSEHLLATREHESRLEDAEPLPVVVALKTAIEVATQRLGQALGDSQRETMATILVRLLAAARRGDGGPSMVATYTIRNVDVRNGEQVVADVLRAAWTRAVELDYSPEMVIVRSTIDQVVSDEVHGPRDIGLELASYAVVVTVWSDYFRAHDMWRWFWSLVKDPGSVAAHRLGAIRIGATALLSGEVSLAVLISLALRDAKVRMDALEDWIKLPGVRLHEQYISDHYGHYLLKDAEAAERSFCRFAERVAGAVP